MAGKRFGKCNKTARHELKPHVVVPFPKRTWVADQAQTIVEPYRWFRFRLRNGFTRAVQIAEADVGRLWGLVQGSGKNYPFAVFDSLTRHIALNLRHMTCSQFDGNLRAGLLADALSDTRTVDIVFAESKEPLHIEVMPDEFALSGGRCRERSDSLDDDAAATLVQVAMLFSYCESTRAGSDYIERLRDVSFSSIWIRLNDVALVTAPLGHIKTEVARHQDAQQRAGAATLTRLADGRPGILGLASDLGAV